MPEDWNARLSDGVILRVVGVDAYQRGSAYAQQGRVLELTVDPTEKTLYGTVLGSRATAYHTIATAKPSRSGPAEQWSGHCTCPMASNCKHVAAVMFATRERAVGRLGHPQPALLQAWERPLAQLVRAQPADDDEDDVPLGLQFEVVPIKPSTASDYARAAAGRPGRRIRIRPVTPGKNGAWVRTGTSWRSLQSAYDHPAHAAAHREALEDIYSAVNAAGAAYRYGGYSGYGGYGPEPAVHLDDFGPVLWGLLDQAVRAGVQLVPAKPAQGPVTLSSHRGDVSMDVRRAGSAGGVVVEPVVRAGPEVLPADELHLIGSPPHGAFVERPVPLGVHLVPLQRRLDESVSALVESGQRIEVPEAGLDRFFTSYYPVLRQVVTVTSSDTTVALPEPRTPRLGLVVTHLPGHRAELDWSFVYPVAMTSGDGGVERSERVPLRDPASSDVVRDRPAERQLLEGLDLPDQRLPQLRPTTITGEHHLVPHSQLAGLDAVFFVEHVLPLLRGVDEVVVDEVGAAPNYRESDATPVVSLSTADLTTSRAPGSPDPSDASDSSDWFELGVEVSIAGEAIPFDRLFTALARDESHLVLDSGTYFSIRRPELEQLRQLIEEARSLQDRESDTLRISPLQAGLWEELVELGVVEHQSRRWADTVGGLLDLQAITPAALPSGIDADLRHYQLEGYHWLSFLWQHRLGGILADDMGLGKTLQSLALVAHVKESGQLTAPFLVVAPTSVVPNWAAEAARFAPGLVVRTVTETQARGDTPLPERLDGADLVITSYALLRLDYPAYEALPWSGLVLDEAQFVKNHQAKTYQCARRLPAPFKLAITGTPLENTLMDLWALLSIVAPGLFPSPQRFSEVYRKPIERGTAPELLATLRRRIRPLLLRRTKEQVATELPPKQEQVLEVALNPRHQKIYQTHLQRERQKVLRLLDDLDKNRFAVFRSLTLLRQLSLDPSLVDPKYADVRSSKVDALMDQLVEVVSGGHRALVFSQFTGFLRVVRERLDADGIAYSYLDGRTRDRARRIAEFKDGVAPLFLISLKAGGFGLNLTEADYVFVLDPWWNPAAEAQAVDRTHRIGQSKTVMVYRLVSTGTIEEKVMELKARKSDLFAKVMDDEGLLSAPLTAADISGLLA